VTTAFHGGTEFIGGANRDVRFSKSYLLLIVGAAAKALGRPNASEVTAKPQILRQPRILSSSVPVYRPC